MRSLGHVATRPDGTQRIVELFSWSNGMWTISRKEQGTRGTARVSETHSVSYANAYELYKYERDADVSRHARVTVLTPL